MAIALSGCTTMPRPSPAIEVHHFALAPGFMGDEGLDLTVGSDGKIVFKREVRIGEPRLDNRWLHTTRVLHVDPVAYAAFRAGVDPLRPEGKLDLSASERCQNEFQDNATLTVEWSGGARPPAELFLYIGCDRKLDNAFAAALAHLPGLKRFVKWLDWGNE